MNDPNDLNDMDDMDDMDVTERLAREMIKTWTWSGYYSPDQIQEMIDYFMEPGVDEAGLRAAVGLELEKKKAEEAQWPRETDCDRLDAAFTALGNHGILALQNAGDSMSEGREDVFTALSEHPKGRFHGYCFFHGQDVQRAVEGDGLFIAFGHVNGEEAGSVEVGKQVRDTLEESGFAVEWDESAYDRIWVEIDWKRRHAV